MYTESDLSLTREKTHFLWIRAAYQLARIFEKVAGRERTLRICANGAWILARLGFERAGELYGDSFHTETQALSLEFVQRHVTPESTVVDIGCATGRWCRALSYAKQVVGIDYDSEDIEKARQLGGKVDYVVGDATRDLAGRNFDFALLSHVIEHIDGVDDLLGSLHGVARKLIVEVPDVESDPLNWVRVREGTPFYWDGDHVREYTREIFLDQLERNGWKVIEWRQEKRTILAVAESTRGP